MENPNNLNSRMSIALSKGLEKAIKAAAKRAMLTASSWARLALKRAVEESKETRK